MNHSKLLQYSSLAGAFMAMHAVDGSIVYTDLNPDIELTTFNSSIQIDMNDDGINDFEFKNWNKHFTTYNSYGEPMHAFDLYVQWVGPDTLGLNRIAANQILDYKYNVGVYVYYYPFALNSGDLISSEISFFWYWINQSLAFKKFTADDSTPRLFDTNGYWAPGVEEKFLGVYFADAHEEMHYGWIRCSVIDTAEGIIIHDYAYETEPEKPIIAGSMFGELETLQESDFIIYSNNNAIYTYINQETLENLYINVYDLQGNLVYKTPIHSNASIFTTLLPKGVYIVNIMQNNDNIISSKIAL